MKKKAMLHGMKCIELSETTSTQTYLKNRIDSLQDTPWIAVSASQQTGGYGRRKTGWVAPPGKGLLLSVLSPFPPSPQTALVASLSLATTLHSLGFTPTIKWPNDILLRGKKVAGLLVEGCSNRSLVGIGVNVLHTEKDLQPVDQPATSLLAEGKTVSILDVRTPLLSQLEEDLTLLESQGFSHFHETYMELLGLSAGDSFQLRYSGEIKTALFHTLTPEGYLIVDIDGERKRIA